MADELTKKLLSVYNTCNEQKITDRFFTYEAFTEMLTEKAFNSPIFKSKTCGHSFENRNIYACHFGKGEKKAMLWSRMHGNEPTSTMAFFDILNFFIYDIPEVQKIKNTIINNLSILWLPTVNPDGAAVFSRYNAQSIDINRDYHSLISPEAKALRKTHEAFKPAFGFNLHDQDILWSLVGSQKPATISLLAPAYNKAVGVNPVRKQAIKLSAAMYRSLKDIIPNQIGRYNDAYEPRAFGDNFQASGSSTILLESGGFIKDPEKQVARKCNFISLLTALYSIATNGYKKEETDTYFSIPENEKTMFYIVIKDVEISANYQSWTTDIGINYHEEYSAKKNALKNTFYIAEIGDLKNKPSYHRVSSSNVDIIINEIPKINNHVIIRWSKNRPSNVKF